MNHKCLPGSPFSLSLHLTSTYDTVTCMISGGDPGDRGAGTYSVTRIWRRKLTARERNWTALSSIRFERPGVWCEWRNQATLYSHRKYICKLYFSFDSEVRAAALELQVRNLRLPSPTIFSNSGIELYTWSTRRNFVLRFWLSGIWEIYPTIVLKYGSVVPRSSNLSIPVPKLSAEGAQAQDSICWII